MADSFQKRQRSIRRKQRQKDKAIRRQERQDSQPLTAEEIAENYFDGMRRDLGETEADESDSAVGSDGRGAAGNE